MLEVRIGRRKCRNHYGEANLEVGYGGGRQGDASGCRRRHALARKAIGRGDDESHRKSVTGGLDLDGTDRRMDGVSWSVDCVEGLEGRGETRRSVHGEIAIVMAGTV